MNNYNPALTKHSQQLRKNMTPEENRLWYQFLKDCPFCVKRQKVISNYIVDFYIPSKKVIIEIDGSQHFTQTGKNNDDIRDNNLTRLGYIILRYSNDDIHYRFDIVCEDILSKTNRLT